MSGTEASIIGARAADHLSQLNFDTVFIGASSLSENGVVFDYSLEDTESKRVLLANARRRFFSWTAPNSRASRSPGSAICPKSTFSFATLSHTQRYAKRLRHRAPSFFSLADPGCFRPHVTDNKRNPQWSSTSSENRKKGSLSPWHISGALPGAPLYDADGGMDRLIADVVTDIEKLQAAASTASCSANETIAPICSRASTEKYRRDDGGGSAASRI